MVSVVPALRGTTLHRTAGTRRPSGRLTASVILLAAGSAIELVAISAARGRPAIVGSVIGMVVLAAGALGFASRNRTGTSLANMELAPWLVVYVAITFGVTSLAWLEPQGGVASIIQQIRIPAAVVAVAAFLMVFSLASLFRSSFLSRPMERLSAWAVRDARLRFRTRNVPVVVYLIGVSARLLRLALGQYAYLGNASQALNAPSSINQVLAQLELFTRFATVLLILDAAVVTRSHRSRILLLSALSLECAFAGVSGVKGELTALAFAVGIGLVASGYRLRARWALLFTAVFLVLIPVNLTYREQIIRMSGSSGSPLSVVQQFPNLASDTLSQNSAPQVLVDSSRFVAQRLREIDNVALIMQRSPNEIPFRPATELVVGPLVGLVPRALWQDKPILSTGYDFSQQYYDLPPTLYTASAVTVPGDLFRHGGWLPLLVGGALLGLLVQAVQKAFNPRVDPRTSLFYCGLFLTLLNVESDVITMAVSFVQVLLIAAILTRFCFGRGT